MIVCALNLVTVVISPALPAETTTGVVFAQRRVKCVLACYFISPNCINLCRVLSVFYMDKTGNILIPKKKIIKSVISHM